MAPQRCRAHLLRNVTDVAWSPNTARLVSLATRSTCFYAKDWSGGMRGAACHRKSSQRLVGNSMGS